MTLLVPNLHAQDLAEARGSLEPVARRLRSGALDQAWEMLAPLLRSRPEDPLVQTLAGSVAWRQHRKTAAIGYWKTAAELDPKSPAVTLLRLAAPEIRPGCRLVEGEAPLATVFEFAADFRQQREVERALASFTTKKGIPLTMKTGDWKEFLAFFEKSGYLEHPGAPPSGRGQYVSDGEDGIRSTVYGSWRNRDLAPEALKSDDGFCAFPGDVVALIARNAPGALEFGLELLSAADLARDARKLGGVIYSVRDPWGRQAVLRRLTRISLETKFLPPALRPWLAGLARAASGEQRWWALALERRFGLAPSLPIPPHHLPRVLVSLESGEVPIEAGLLALEAFEKGADSQLVELLQTGSELRLRVFTELAVRLDGPAATAFLVETLASEAPRWVNQRRLVLGALRRLAGEDRGTSVEAWRTWSRDRRR